MAFPVNAVLGGLSLLSGFVGNRGRNPDEQRLLRIQMDAANRLRQYGIGVPGADPGERAALEQNLGILGQQQAQQQRQMFASLSPHQGVGSLQDFLQNTGSLQTSQQMALSSTHLLDALQQRRQALQAAAGTAQGAAGLASQRGAPSALPGLMGQLSQSMAYKRAFDAYNRANQPGGGGASGGTGPLASMVGIGQHLGAGNQTVEWTPATAGGARQHAQGPMGLSAPGNEVGGMNTHLNLQRQSFGWSPGLAEQIRKSMFG